MLTRLSLRLRIFLFFAFLAMASSILAIAGLALGYSRLGEAHALSAFVIAGVIAVLAIFALTTWVWVLFDENVAKPVERLAAEMRARAHADVEGEIDHGEAKFLGDLGSAAAAVASNLTETRNAMALAVGRETARLTTEKTRLETLLAEMPDGVLFCTPDHRIALYNGHCRDILGETEAVGLGRSVMGLLKPGPIEQAYARLVDGEAEDGTDLLVTTRAGARLLEARMRLLRLEGQETETPGYVLTLRDLTTDLATHAERAHLFDTFLDGVKDTLPDLPEGMARDRLATLTEETDRRKAPTDTQWWPMEALSARDLGTALSTRLTRKGLSLDNALGDTGVRCDGFAITRLLERLALEWSGIGGKDLSLRIVAEAPDHVVLSLEAAGDAPAKAEVADWLETPLSPGLTRFSGRDVLTSHGTRLLPEPAGPGHAALRLRLPLADPKPPVPSRVVLYDFELLNAAIPDDLAAAALRDLSYVIFDTETTGLNPQVDEICQIAAVRVVNGRLVDGERFDMLVNPGRKIPAASTAVHHITDAMVADAVDVSEAIERFHAFADGSVLVAHNAPFDMSFLRRREREIGKRFDQPILDTVLCSAILYGQSAEHTLDALSTRLGVSIPDEARHTAIGDAIGTGEAFRKMIPMLEAAELPNLGALIQAFDRHTRLIEHLN
ncbi:DNA polymerase III epsilon subunit [Roseibacterium elongatum DSM 19469]|uniref:DNA-directed DNA polymerase n=1 Tax=Roseicyclus elongatus DSM 19469 TaxID=1294273 RepID=W8RYU2_9RHOB|nr:exonuclease domain-containing protein [Roseibacterium elongatum]AHM03022.1 DNA polymerase III epsilon subunit [Roseibacterium elongatum DSM 19469]